MNKVKIKRISIIATIVIFIALFIISTIIYLVFIGTDKNIYLEYSNNDFKDIKNIDDIVKQKLEVESNDIFVFNGGEIEYDFANNELTKINIDLLVRHNDKYVHYQVQLDSDKLILIKISNLKEPDIIVLSTLNNVLEHISKINHYDNNSNLIFTIDNVITDSISISPNNYIINASEWKPVQESVNGRFFKIILNDNINASTNYIKNYYVQIMRDWTIS